MIKITKDYSKFTFLNENRATSKSHVLALVRSLKKKDLMEDNPILINDKFQILDGQHRYKALMLLEWPITYKMSKVTSSEDVVELQLSRNWTPIDFLDRYVEQGDANYIKFKSFMSIYSLTGIGDTIKVLRGRRVGNHSIDGDTLKTFKNGLFEYPKNDFKARQTMNMINEIGLMFNNNKTKAFIGGALTLVTDERYDHKHLLGKLKKNRSKCRDCNSIPTYHLLLEELYNKNVATTKYVKFSCVL